MQDHPGAPGTARQGPTRIIMLVKSGGNATQPRAPGHERPPAALSAARHGRLSAATGAPGADVPLASTAGAPGQYCLSAAPRAPGHGRPLAALSAAGHDRLSAALRAPGADVPLATTARAPGHHRRRAAPIATAPMPAGVSRLRQAVLPRVPATPNTLTYQHSHSLNRHSRECGNPRPPVATGGPQGGYAPATCVAYSQPRTRPTTHQVHPAIQVPPRPRSCSTACTGLLLLHPSRAPPPPAYWSVAASSLPLHNLHPLSTWWRGGRVTGHSRTTPGTIRAAVARQGVRPAAAPTRPAPSSAPAAAPTAPRRPSPLATRRLPALPRPAAGAPGPATSGACCRGSSACAAFSSRSDAPVGSSQQSRSATSSRAASAMAPTRGSPAGSCPGGHGNGNVSNVVVGV